MGARKFNGSNQSLLALTAPADVDVTMACWWNQPSRRGETLMCLSRSGGFVSHALGMTYFGFDTTLQAITDDGAGGSSATLNIGNPTNKWQFSAASFIAANSRKVYFNNTVGSNTSNRPITSLTRTAIGRGSPGAGGYSTANIALPAVWYPALSDAELRMLAMGLHPSLVSPWSLVNGWDLGESGVSCDPAFAGSVDASFVNSPIAVQGPPDIILPPHERFAAELFAQAGGVPAAYYRLLMQQLGIN